MKPNPIVWFEIYVQDLARARKFYETVFQCTLEPMAASGGKVSSMEMLGFPMTIDAPGGGGQIHKPRFSIGQYGYCALIMDTEGNTIGLHSMQ